MGYFPFYMEIENKKCLIVGGGKTALRKTEKLIGFNPDITVIAPEICAELQKLPVRKVYRDFRDEDIKNAFMVITATDDRSLNRHVSELCKAEKIPVNSVDDMENCSFVFPALVHTHDITIGISTGGTSPTFAKFLRQIIEDEIDGHYLEIADTLKKFRPIVLKMFSTEEIRREAMEAILDFCLIDDKIPDDEEIHNLLEAIHENKNRYKE